MVKNLNLINQKILCSFLTLLKISREEAKNLQQDYEKYLNDIRKGNRSVEQKKTLGNINVLFNARNNAIKFIEYYGSMILEAKRQTSRTRRNRT